MFHLINLFKFLIMIIMVLLSVALLTLLERKILSYIQIRKGPNKVGILGLIQPFADGMKLFLKEDLYPLYTNKLIFYISPIFGLFIALMMVGFFPYVSLSSYLKWSVLLFLCLSSVSVYSIIFSGWSSLSKYSHLGSYRAVAQTISYEVSMSFILISLILFYEKYNMSNYSMSINLTYMLLFPFLVIWMGVILAETNRSPFDLSESESELVSGFNTEYSGGGFALIFIAEYSNIIMMSIISSFLFFNGYMFFFMFIIMLYLWIRGSFPRIRYDILMFLSWKMYLPLVLGMCMYMSMIYFMQL